VRLDARSLRLNRSGRGQAATTLPQENERLSGDCVWPVGGDEFREKTRCENHRQLALSAPSFLMTHTGITFVGQGIKSDGWFPLPKVGCGWKPDVAQLWPLRPSKYLGVSHWTVPSLRIGPRDDPQLHRADRGPRDHSIPGAEVPSGLCSPPGSGQSHARH
jgi:hypothetical protein